MIGVGLSYFANGVGVGGGGGLPTPLIVVDFTDPANYTINTGKISSAANIGTLGGSFDEGSDTRRPVISQFSNGEDCASFSGGQGLTLFSSNAMPQVGDGLGISFILSASFDVNNGYEVLFTFRNTSGDDWFALVNQDNFFTTRLKDGGTSTYGLHNPWPVVLGQTYIVAGRKNTNNTYDFWIDGIKVLDAVAFSQAAPNSFNNLDLGRVGAGSHWDGRLGRAEFYDSELTDTEMADIMASYAAQFQS